MRQTIWLLVLLLASASAAAGQESKRGGYVGEERREIKSLPAEEIEGLLQGRGMGLAKAAELNHYPGPRHVLELAEKLEITAGQRAGAQAAFEKMRAEAIRHGSKIVELERELDRLFAKGRIEDARMREITAEIGRAQGLLRAAHLAAHLEMRRLLSPRQIARYDELRGYTTGRKTGGAAAHDGHGKH
jgi:Spy/CpxP family protein refolding chaperone